MARSKPSPDNRQLLERINAVLIDTEDMTVVMEELNLLDRKDRGFEGTAFVATRLFCETPDKAVSIMFRLEALARLVRRGQLPGWTKRLQSEGATLVQEALFAAAGQQPLVEKRGRFEFDRRPFLVKAFQLAKNLE